MLISQVWVDLAEHGVRLHPDASDQERHASPAGPSVVLAGPGFGPTAWDVSIVPRGVRPSRLEEVVRERLSELTGRPLIVIVPVASAALKATARRLGVSLLIAPEREDQPTTGFVVHPTGSSVELPDQTTASTASTARTPGRTPWATYAVAFELLKGETVTQSALAVRLGVTQARISQVMRSLPGALRREPSGWRLADPDQLLGWLVRSYPPPAFVTTWLTLDPVVQFARRLEPTLASRDVSGAVSGEVAADAIAPYANPTQLLLCLTHQIDLSGEGAVPAPPSVANITVATPDDPFVLRSVTPTAAGYGVVDVWRIVVDLYQHDAVQAAEELTRAARSNQLAHAQSDPIVANR